MRLWDHLYSTSLTTVNFVKSAHVSVRTFFEWVWHKIFWTLLGFTVAKVCASPRNLTWSTRPFSPHERVGSGDNTRIIQQWVHYIVSVMSWCFFFQCCRTQSKDEWCFAVSRTNTWTKACIQGLSYRYIMWIGKSSFQILSRWLVLAETYPAHCVHDSTCMQHLG